MDNDLFAGPSTDTANESLVDPFGLDVTGYAGWPEEVLLTAPTHPVANGPFGSVTSITQYAGGWFSNLGPYAVSLGILEAQQQCAIAVIERGSLAPGSGVVITFSDTSMIWDYADWGGFITEANTEMVLNAIAYAVPEPSAALLLAVGGMVVIQCRRTKG